MLGLMRGRLLAVPAAVAVLAAVTACSTGATTLVISPGTPVQSSPSPSGWDGYGSPPPTTTVKPLTAATWETFNGGAGQTTTAQFSIAACTNGVRVRWSYDGADPSGFYESDITLEGSVNNDGRDIVSGDYNNNDSGSVAVATLYPKFSSSPMYFLEVGINSGTWSVGLSCA